MKKIFKKSSFLLALALALTSCNKFDEINVDPNAAGENQVQVEYFLNNSIIGAQMDPHIAERVFVLYWKTAGHQHSNGGLSSGGDNDGWSVDYYRYCSEWLNHVNTAIEIAEKQIANGTSKPETANLIEVSRIWRAYLLSELSDNFGSIPIDGFKGVNPEYSDVKTVYYYLLAELKDAAAKLNTSLVTPQTVTKFDAAYALDYMKWKRYANSMRMRLAMRLSEVDAQKAQTEFQDAANGAIYITTMDQAFSVQEKDGYNPLTAVMSRPWNTQPISATINNLYLGLGGVKTEDQLATSFHANIKPANYIGLKFDDHFTSKTNNPSAGYWFDGLPNTIDPRAYKMFIVPGDLTNADFANPTGTDAKNTVRNLVDANNAVVKVIDAKNTWNASNTGDWGAKGAKNLVRAYEGTIPRLANKFRNHTQRRIFFAPWETYFLLAEAAERGWTVPMTGKAAYEAGVASSFAYWGVTDKLNSYLASLDFNRVGTSVSWDHTAEPGNSHTMSFINGYTNVAGTATVLYPKNDLYKNGTVKNDHLTKIITQKFIAQTPWLPLETWSDHRRLGLPFFENPAIENVLPNLTPLNDGNFMTSNIKFFPQRIRYPSSLRDSNPKGYAQAVSKLGGADAVLTPLWWAKQQ